MSRRNVTFRILLVFAVVAGAVDALLFALAIGNLAQGPSPLGYDFLASANRAAALVATAAAAAAISKSFATPRAIVVSVQLLLAGGIAAGIAGGLYALGAGLAGFAPEAQPIELNSLLLAVQGTGYDLGAVPMVLVVAAIASLALRAFPPMRIAIPSTQS
jgi:hypothetical protein